MIAACAAWDQGTLAVLLDHDPVVRRYRAFFAHLDWTAIPPPRAASRLRLGRTPHPTSRLRARSERGYQRTDAA